MTFLIVQLDNPGVKTQQITAAFLTRNLVLIILLSILIIGAIYLFHTQVSTQLCDTANVIVSSCNDTIQATSIFGTSHYNIHTPCCLSPEHSIENFPDNYALALVPMNNPLPTLVSATQPATTSITNPKGSNLP